MKKRKSARNKQYWLEKGLDEKEAMKMAMSRMPGTPEYFLYYKKVTSSKEEADVLAQNWQENRKNTLSNFIKRHGKEDGERRFNEYRSKQAYSNTLEYMIKKYGVEEGTEKYYSANKKRAITLENCVDKHGEEKGTVVWNGYVEKQRTAGISLEYFIEKHGKEAGTEIHAMVNKKKLMTFEGFLFRANGDVEAATVEFNKYQQNLWKSSIKNRGVSKSSQIVFSKIRDKLVELGYLNFYFADHNCEWGVNIINKNRYVYFDFFLKDTGKAIEYNGNYYHANPRIYDKDFEVSIYGVKKRAEEIWESDRQRILDIKSVPYVKDVLTIWEDECNVDIEKVVKKCVKFLIE